MKSNTSVLLLPFAFPFLGQQKRKKSQLQAHLCQDGLKRVQVKVKDTKMTVNQKQRRVRKRTDLAQVENLGTDHLNIELTEQNECFVKHCLLK